MLEKMNLVGAIVALIIYISSILTFSSRLLFAIQPGHWLGYPLLLMAFPLGYLLLKAPQLQRPILYYIQVGLMLVWILVSFSLDYVLKIDFRQNQWMVIAFVVLYFAGAGGMIGVLLGCLGSTVINKFAQWGGAIIQPWAVVISFGLSVLVGVFFGMYPAVSASKLDPIEALRYE